MGGFAVGGFAAGLLEGAAEGLQRKNQRKEQLRQVVTKAGIGELTKLAQDPNFTSDPQARQDISQAVIELAGGGGGKGKSKNDPMALAQSKLLGIWNNVYQGGEGKAPTQPTSLDGRPQQQQGQAQAQPQQSQLESPPSNPSQSIPGAQSLHIPSMPGIAERKGPLLDAKQISARAREESVQKNLAAAQHEELVQQARLAADQAKIKQRQKNFEDIKAAGYDEATAGWIAGIPGAGAMARAERPSAVEARVKALGQAYFDAGITSTLEEGIKKASGELVKQEEKKSAAKVEKPPADTAMVRSAKWAHEHEKDAGAVGDAARAMIAKERKQITGQDQAYPSGKPVVYGSTTNSQGNPTPPKAYVVGGASKANPNHDAAIEDGAITYLTTNKFPYSTRALKGQIDHRDIWHARAGELMKEYGMDTVDRLTAAEVFKSNASALKKVTDMGAMVGQFEKTIQGNLQVARQLSDEYNRPNSPALNKVLAGLRGEVIGDPAVKNFVAQMDLLATEIAKLQSGAASAAQVNVSAKEEAKAYISSNLGKYGVKQMFDKVILPDMENRKNGVEREKKELRDNLRGSIKTVQGDKNPPKVDRIFNSTTGVTAILKDGKWVDENTGKIIPVEK